MRAQIRDICTLRGFARSSMHKGCSHALGSPEVLGSIKIYVAEDLRIDHCHENLRLTGFSEQ